LPIKHAVNINQMKMWVKIQSRTETLYQRHRTSLRTGFHCEASTFDEPGADYSVNDGKDFRDHRRLSSKKVSQLIRYTQHPLTNRAIGEDVRSGVPVDQMGSTVSHAPGAA
jgi:hypothetical protein